MEPTFIDPLRPQHPSPRAQTQAGVRKVYSNLFLKSYDFVNNELKEKFPFNPTSDIEFWMCRSWKIRQRCPSWRVWEQFDEKMCFNIWQSSIKYILEWSDESKEMADKPMLQAWAIKWRRRSQFIVLSSIKVWTRCLFTLIDLWSGSPYPKGIER